MQDNSLNILSIIPQSYYDIPAKIVPGIIAFEFLCFELKGNILLPDNLYNLFLGLIIIYILGVFFDISGLFLCDCIDSIVNSLHEEYKRFDSQRCPNLYADCCIHKPLIPSIDEIHKDIYKLSRKEDESVIIKILSEVVLLRSLSLIPIVIPAFDFLFLHIKSKYFIQSIVVAIIFNILRSKLQIAASNRMNKMQKLSRDPVKENP